MKLEFRKIYPVKIILLISGILVMFMYIVATLNFDSRDVAYFQSGMTSRQSTIHHLPLINWMSKTPFTIHILTWNRPHSFERLLNSLLESEFNGDIINLVIHIDGGHNINSSYARAKYLHWPFGKKIIKKKIKHNGLAEAWLDAWIPHTSSELVVIFEDDIIVSPWWYKWIKTAWDNYLFRNDIAGISLQRQNLIPEIPPKNLEIINNNKPFLFALVGSIGFSPHPIQWSRFLNWMKEIDLDKFDVSIPKLITTKWYKKGKMWTQHFIYFCIKHKLYTLYVNLPQKRALAEHWKEKGVHFSKTLGPMYKVAENISGTMIFPQSLNKYNFAGKLIKSK